MTDAQVRAVHRCDECGELIAVDDVHAGHGMCGSCVHDAVRSGWDPEATS